MLDIEAESIVRLWKGVGRTSVINRIAGGSPTIDESNMRLLHVEKLHAKKCIGLVRRGVLFYIP